MILMWIILNQKKWEKKCKENGWEPACTLSDRLFAYFICIVVPVLVGLLYPIK